MATYHKNIAVGLTMLVGLLLLGTMILLFGDAPVKFFQGSQIRIQLDADGAEGLSKGSPVNYLGVSVGKIEGVELAKGGQAVVINASIDEHHGVPANVEGFIRGNLIGGTSTLNLELTGPTPQGTLTSDTRLQAHIGGSTALPKEFTDLAKEIRVLVAQINQNKLADKVAVAVDKVSLAIDSANKTFNKVSDAVDDLRKVLGDDKLRGDIKDTIGNFKAVSENAKTIAKNLETFSTKLTKLSGDFERITVEISGTINKTGTRIDEISKALTQRTDQLAGVLDKMQSIANKIDKGDGTAGKLINDPKLYESLTDTTAELHLTIKDLRRLIQQWEQEGVPFKLGK
jgi:phospholipid/cholesterol/gamma-HCH transport system substrate-binding protein